MADLDSQRQREEDDIKGNVPSSPGGHYQWRLLGCAGIQFKINCRITTQTAGLENPKKVYCAQIWHLLLLFNWHVLQDEQQLPCMKGKLTEKK